ncbi:hypothetical protein SMC26_13970 [Actinomadura fulvescens]|uniref:Uncharacterized protein n=1 Tax=Actinomadura fulvescens TaxID=46160 RepID=A0ABN3Q4S4_9ACTN
MVCEAKAVDVVEDVTGLSRLCRKIAEAEKVLDELELSYNLLGDD